MSRTLTQQEIQQDPEIKGFYEIEYTKTLIELSNNIQKDIETGTASALVKALKQQDTETVKKAIAKYQKPKVIVTTIREAYAPYRPELLEFKASQKAFKLTDEETTLIADSVQERRNQYKT